MADDWEKVEMSPAWVPENVNDELIGVLTAREENVGPNDSMLYTLEKEDHELISVWGSMVLDSRMKNIQIGEIVKIVFLGLGKKQGGKNPAKLFDVFHKKASYSKVDQEEQDFVDDVDKVLKS